MRNISPEIDFLRIDSRGASVVVERVGAMPQVEESAFARTELP